MKLIEDVYTNDNFVLIAVPHPINAILKKTHFRDSLFACRVVFGILLSTDFLQKSTLCKSSFINTISECQTIWIQIRSNIFQP